VCPNCGSDLSIWPPPAGEQPEPVLPRLKTGSVHGDQIDGIVECTVLCLACGLGYLIEPFVYLYERRRYPVRARALGWTYLVFLALGLGAFAVCSGAVRIP
jgi:hypothetical protein